MKAFDLNTFRQLSTQSFKALGAFFVRLMSHIIERLSLEIGER